MTDIEMREKELAEKERAARAEEDLKNRDLNRKEREFQHSRGIDAAQATGQLLRGLAPKGIITALDLGSRDRRIRNNNDPSWYNKNKDLIDSTANLSFLTPVGTKSFETLASIYNIYTMHYVSILPRVKGTGTYLNGEPVSTESTVLLQSAQAAYAAIRRANAGAKNWEAPDYVRYVLLISSLLEFLAMGARAYAAANTYSAKNFAIGAPLLEQLGFNSTDVRQNLANFRTMYNLILNQVNVYALPAEISLILRHVWMASSVFKDHEGEKASLIAFVPELFLRASGDTTKILPIWLSNDQYKDGLTTAQYFELAQNMLDGLRNDPYAAIISGDIQKFLGAGTPSILPVLETNSMLNITYSEEVMTQIENANILGDAFFSNDAAIRYLGEDQTDQGQGAIIIGVNSITQRFPDRFISDASTKWSNNNAFKTNDFIRRASNFLVNMPTDTPSPDEVMVATRLSACAPIRSHNAAGAYFGTVYKHLYACGTEVVTTVSAFNVAEKRQAITRGMDPIYKHTPDGVDRVALFWDTLFQWDWHPNVIIVNPADLTTSNPPAYYTWETRELYNYAVVSIDTIANMHNVAAINEFGLLQFLAYSSRGGSSTSSSAKNFHSNKKRK